MIKNYIVNMIGGVITGIITFIIVVTMFTSGINAVSVFIYLVFGSISAICLVKASVYKSNEQKWDKIPNIVLLIILFAPIGIFYLIKHIKK
jgi:hypothetical protein